MAARKNTTRIALLSDVHGNQPALEAVLEDVAGRGTGELWCGGDFLGYAPFPNEVVQTLRQAGAVSIIGNYDLKVLAFPQKQARWKRKKTPEKYLAFQWNYEHLSPDTKTYLGSLPQQARLRAGGLTVLLVHGSPDSIDEHLGSATPVTRFEELAAAGVDVIACGHSHEAFTRKVQGTWFVNPGSVGRPEGGDWRAAYALLEFTGGELRVEHRRVPYDMERVVRAVRAADLPESFAAVFRQGRSLDQLQETGGTASRSDSGPRLAGPRRVSEPPGDAAAGADAALDAVLAFAQRCRYERGHTHHVTRLALALFDCLEPLHGLGPGERRWLQYGALLHDIGWVEGQQGHHKTALRLILAEPSLPFDRRRRWLIGLIARYHRRRAPQDGDKYFRRLSGADRQRVRVLAGILRVADGLDRSHACIVRSVTCAVSAQEIRMVCDAGGPADSEKAAAEAKADLLESVFHRRCRVEVPVQARTAR
jgi:putative phosphoesterase